VRVVRGSAVNAPHSVGAAPMCTVPVWHGCAGSAVACQKKAGNPCPTQPEKPALSGLTLGPLAERCHWRVRAVAAVCVRGRAIQAFSEGSLRRGRLVHLGWMTNSQ